MDLVDWLKSYPAPDGAPSGKLMPGLAIFIAAVIALVAAIIGLLALINQIISS